MSVATVEPSDTHCYQPGWTLMGGGVFTAKQPRRREEALIPGAADMAVIQIVFDSWKDLLREFSVLMQSTPICFKGRAVVARSTDGTDAVSVAAQLAKVRSAASCPLRKGQ